ncbi:hypothetical protein ACIBG8_03525 [Nonomuraea sp. NPDC050556]|uniref:hypothetical protein n=1 Tax=Nonomuraea sp. NPDC050556 TaxID=3364369 RepID=UPI0037A7B40D
MSACQVGERGLEVWNTGAAGQRTTWQAQPTWNVKAVTYAWNDPLEIDVSAAFLGDDSAVTLGLRATDEKDPLSSFVFGNAAQLVVESATAPPTPTDPTTERKPCDSRPYLNTATPQVRAAVRLEEDREASGRWQWEKTDGTGQRE